MSRAAVEEGRVFFVLCVARSGSTSLARVLDGARNGCCAVEPAPNLSVESRLAWEGRLADRAGAVERAIVPRVLRGLERYAVYGEKNLSYGPFVPDLYARFGCRFVFLHRDGRDVVRSLLDWHDGLFGTVYRECADPGRLTPRALAAAGQLPLRLDGSDFSRPRPARDSDLDAAWEGLSRAEMCAYYWAAANARYRDELEKLPRGAWRSLDYTHVSADAISEVASFLGLEGLAPEVVASQLSARINSLQERTGESGRAPAWPDWDGGMRRRFEALAGAMMEQLGYFRPGVPRWRPEGYARVAPSRRAPALDEARGDAEDATLRAAADAFVAAAARRLGHAPSVAWAFAEREAPPRADASGASAPRLDLALGADDPPPAPPAEAVISTSGLARTFDVELFLRRAVAASRAWVHLSCPGWRPDLSEHAYAWRAEHGTFHNRVSPDRLREQLRSLGCNEVRVDPIRLAGTGRYVATRVVARTPAAAGDRS